MANFFCLFFRLLALSLALISFTAQSAGIPIKEPKRKQPVDFAKEVLPLLRMNCAGCHNPVKAKGGLNLDGYGAIMKGGKNGAVVVPGKPDESPLLTLAAGLDDPVMPPKKNNDVDAKPLKPEELGLIKLWIAQGAKGVDTIEATAVPVKWQPLPSDFVPINSVAVTPDGTHAICSRANQIFVYNVPLGQLVTRLSDPALSEGGVADRDLIQALAMSPDGTLLASGGYRSVKLWRRPVPAQKVVISAASGPAVASPDGKLIATAGPDNSIKLWDAASGADIKTLSGHSAPVTALRFSMDGKRLCSGSTDKSVRIWDVASGNVFAKADSPAPVNAVAWALKDSVVASGGADNLIRTWTVPEQAGGEFKNTGEIKAHTGAVTSLSTWPGNGELILSGSADGSAQILKVQDGSLVHRFDHGAPVTSVAITANGAQCATAGGNSVKLWNVSDKKMIKEFRGSRHMQDGVADADREVTFAKQEVKYFKTTLENAEKKLKADTEAVTRAKDTKTNSEKALTQKQEELKKAVDAREAGEKQFAEPLAELKKAWEEKSISEAALAAAVAENKMAKQCVADNNARLEKANLDLVAAEKAVGEITKKTKSSEAKALKQKAEDLKASANKLELDKAAAAQGVASAAAKVKTAADAKLAAEKAQGEMLAKHKEPDTKIKALQKTEDDSQKALHAAENAKIAADHNVDTNIAAVKAGEAAIAAAKTGVQNSEALQKQTEAALETAKKVAADAEKPMRAIAISRDGKILAAAGDEGSVQTWNAETGAPVDQFKPSSGSLVSLDFLPNNAVISAGSDGKVTAWNAESDWKLERTIGTGDEKSPLIGRVLALSFSTDGKWLATGGGIPARMGEVKIWQVSDGSLARELKDPHSDTVYGLEFSYDGKYLATCGADKFLKIFNAADGKLVKNFEGHSSHVLGVSWNRSGRTLMTCSADKSIKVWDFTIGEQAKTITLGRKEITVVHYVGVSETALAAAGEGYLRIVKEDGNNNARNFDADATDYVQSAALTPSGSFIVAGGKKGNLRVWDGTNGQLVRTYSAQIAVEQAAKK